MDGKEFYNKSQFVTGTIVYPVMTVLGILGNSLLLLGLRHPHLQNRTNIIVRALAVCDILSLTNNLLYAVYSVLLLHHPKAAERMICLCYRWSHFIFNYGECTSAWLTVCIGLDRYWRVCKVAFYQNTYRPRHTKRLVLAVYVSCAILTLPTTFNYDCIATPSNDSQVNETTTDYSNHIKFENTTLGRTGEALITGSSVISAGNSTINNFPTSNSTATDLAFTITKTAFSQSTWFKNGYLRTFLIVACSVSPVLLLIGTSLCTIRHLKAGLSQVSAISDKMTRTMLVIDLSFVLCTSPDAILTILMGHQYIESSYTVRGIREISDCLLLLNCTINFAIYVIANSKFRKCFVEMVGCNRNQAATVQIELIPLRERLSPVSTGI